MSRRINLLLLIGLGMIPAPRAHAQPRPYIGFVYPAGGQQGTTFEIRLGGQGFDDVNAVLLSGSGVTARLVEHRRRLNNQEIQLLNEQARALRRLPAPAASALEKKPGDSETNDSPQQLVARIERRVRETVQTPACASIATLTIVEITIAADAEPGRRELRLGTARGISNPLIFHIGQFPESSRKPMPTASLQILGKEAQSLRKRPAEEVEDRVTLPCTLNGQIASGEVNRYRFVVRKGQHLVISTLARQLIPYIADAVPGWFQPVLTLSDANGREVAFDDDYRFKPDPVIHYEVPRDGEYVLGIYDSIYRGREDFVYRITLGEQPFVTSLFPLGRQVAGAVVPEARGWNLQETRLTSPPAMAPVGICSITANRNGLVSLPAPFAVDVLRDVFEKEPNNSIKRAQKISLPVIVNGRIDQPGDWDVFQFNGKSNQTIVAEVQARRLDSPLDSVIKLTDAAGNLVAFSDDQDDLADGVNTHHADSWFTAALPADGAYFIHIGDTARHGGEEYGYRLRISEPQPDFELRVVPSSIALRSKSTSQVSVYVMRKDGFNGPIEIALKDSSPGFSSSPVTLSGTQTVARLNIKTDLVATKDPVNLAVAGKAKIGEKEIVREAVPAEDRMQAFLWRHLVPALDLKALVFDPSYLPQSKRVPPVRPATAVPVSTASASAKPKFTRQQVVGRLRELRRLYEENLLTDDFYNEKVAECESVP